MIFKIKTANFLPHQLVWWGLPNFIKLLVGGYGCGKTYIGALRAFYLSYLNSGIPGQYVSPNYPLAKKTIIITILEIARRANLDLQYNKTDHEFFIKNWNGHFWIGSGDDPLSLRGPNLAWAGIDEPFIQSLDVLEQMLARVRVKDAKQSEIFLTGTPESLNWGYDLAMNEDKKYDIGYVVGKTIDNPHLSEAFYENVFNAYTPEMREAYLEGKFVNLNVGRAYKVFDRNRHVVHRDVDGVPICIGLDFNVDYMSAEIFAHGNGWIHFIDEVRLSNSNSYELSEKLAKMYPGVNTYPDATGALRKSSSTKSDHQIFRDAGFGIYARKANPAIMDRVNATNGMLMKDNLTIEPDRCPLLVKDFERVTFNKGDLDKQSDPSLTHASDAATYPVAYLYPVRRNYVTTIRS